MLEICRISKNYRKTIAVDDVSFTIPDGEVGILLGPNGAGKSTIMKSIAGLLKHKGKAMICGIPARTKEARTIFSYVPEMPSMYPSLTIDEHLEFVSRAYNVQLSDEKKMELYERFDLSDKHDKLGSELSKGMMQKVSICCALITNPKVLILDEPMVGLDPKAIKELREVVLELKSQGVTVLISTHMLEMVRDLWDIMIVMDKGKVIGTYAKKDAEEHQQDIEDIFFSITESEGGEQKDV